MNNLPPYEIIENALRTFFNEEQGAVPPSYVYRVLADQFELTPSQLAVQRPDSRGSLFENRVQWAREALAKKGIIDRGPRGYWMVTPQYRNRQQTINSAPATHPAP